MKKNDHHFSDRCVHHHCRICVWYRMPTQLLPGVKASDVSRIEVFDGNTGKGFDIDAGADIARILDDLQSATLRRDLHPRPYGRTLPSDLL